MVLFSGIAVVSLFVLRSKSPTAARPFRAWGYPVAPAVFVIASAMIVVSELWQNPQSAVAGIAVIALGVPLYFLRRP